MCSTLDFAHSVNHVSERIAVPFECATLELSSAVNHLAEHRFEILTLHLAVAARRAQHRRKSNAVETGVDELVKCAAQLEVGGRHRHPGRNLHATLK